MATEAQCRAFISKIAPCAQAAYKALGKVHPSVCIGMACVESGYGTAGSAKYNSFIGQKVGTGKTATKYWTGTFKSWKTKEEYTVGTHTVITDAFRTYPSMEMCVYNYYELLNSKLYAIVKADADYKTQMQQIKAVGYMTSSTEVNTVLKIIKNYNLTQYDFVQNDLLTSTKCPYPEPTAILRKGMHSIYVKWLQWHLNNCGIGYCLNEDGDYGDITTGAVLDFQKRAKLKYVDGICGSETRNALIKRV